MAQVEARQNWEAPTTQKQTSAPRVPLDEGMDYRLGFDFETTRLFPGHPPFYEDFR